MKEQKFWNWFSENQNLYFDFEQNQAELFDRLHKKLNEVNENITFEFSPKSGSGKREFVLSADGIKSSFPSVTKLVESAPSFDNWIIVAFRQPHLECNQIHYKDIRLYAEDTYFRYAKDNRKIGIELNIRNYQDNDDWGVAIFLLLDTILGEYDTEMMLSWIEMKKLDENEIEKLYPVKELPSIISEHKKEQWN